MIEIRKRRWNPAIAGLLIVLCAGEMNAEGASFEAAEDRPLVEAIDRNDTSRVRALLKSGADPNDFAGTHDAAIHAAAAKGDTKIAAALLEAGADINLRNKHVQERTPLFYAVDWGLIEMVRFLIAKGANVNARTSHGYSVLHLATGSPEHAIEIVRLLVKHGADVNAAADNKTTVLQSAVQDGNHEAIEFLLASGANPEAATYFGTTVISDAVMGADEEIVRVLLKHEVSLSTFDSSKGFLPLHYAADDCNSKIAEMLLTAGADPSLRSKDGRLAEDIARSEGCPELADVLRTRRVTRAPGRSINRGR